MWLQPSECTHRGLVQAYFSVCISPYIIHIHAWWHKRIFLFSSLMFICSENYHQETWIYRSPPSGGDGRFKLIVSHLQDGSTDCLRQSAHLRCKSDIHESLLKWGSKYCCDYISHKERRFDHTHKEDHTSKRAKAARREGGGWERCLESFDPNAVMLYVHLINNLWLCLDRTAPCDKALPEESNICNSIWLCVSIALITFSHVHIGGSKLALPTNADKHLAVWFH